MAVSLGSGFGCTAEPVYLGLTDETSQKDGGQPACEGLEICFTDEGLSEADVAPFLGAVDSAPSQGALEPSPSWVYPLAGSVHPSNLGLISFHFKRGQKDQETFEVSLSDGQQSFRMFIPCPSAGGEGCVFQAPERFWAQLSTALAGKTVNLKLRARGSRGISLPTGVELTFSSEPVQGGLYYWSAELRGIYRLLFGGRQAVPYVAPGTEENPEDCAGCHSVSRDGGTIALIYGSADPEASFFENAAFSGGLRVSRVTAPETPIYASPGDEPGEGGMVALSSDGARVASAADSRLTLRNVETGVLLDETSRVMGKIPFFPEFSPDNSRLVLTLTETADTEIAVRDGSIATVSVLGDRFGEVRELVPAEEGKIFYYPTWSPDGKWVAYVSGPAGLGDDGKSYDQIHAHLKMVSVETGVVVDLSQASGPAGSTSTWPKFAPFSQCAPGYDSCSDDEKIFFLSYSSKRAYGLVANQTGQEAISQLWMSAIFVARAENDTDPSSAPFWVPYQAPSSRNHLGFWTEALRCSATLACGPGYKCNGQGECEVLVR